MAEKDKANVHIQARRQTADKGLEERIASEEEGTTEANLELQDTFYGDSSKRDGIVPTYNGQSGTPAININPKR
ncbi:hypothetical protein [Mesobacillus foraminis]|uniref:Uncharacterized protein n=1 Tax=Mesobacillus foraminis TaxID=279826 RepID=A0A4R2BJQ9_9BACI|nr:hypothetical protein [Mesobacillus foraminis]TCN26865.1 hypothetical protein EV146_103391 [Mesobacillus foraminis]